jgi:hypothetical protein
MLASGDHLDPAGGAEAASTTDVPVIDPGVEDGVQEPSVGRRLDVSVTVSE